jgi:Protein of unknown function (DUF3224)
MTTRAQGPFEVKLNPLPLHEAGQHATLARMSLDKQFHGDLDGTSHGEMLTAAGTVKSSAAYVAIERFTGTLHGREGSFALQHTGLMTRGTPGLTISVVPDSGTEGLTGLTGTMTINIVDGKHSYGFDYSLP